MVWCPRRTTLGAVQLLLMIVRVTMDLFQHRYYRLNKTLMMLIGQWPYQSSRAKYCFRAVIIYINTSEMLARILDIVKHRNDFDILLECAQPLFSDIVCAIILIFFISNSHKTLQLLNRIRTDWHMWARHREVNILHEYAEQGQKINIVFTGLMYIALFTDVTSLVMLKIIDGLLNNGTEPGKFPTRVDYYRIDKQKYYFYVMMYYCVILVMIVMVLAANNVMLVSYVQHACGIFAALGQKLKRIGNNDITTTTGETSYALDKRDIIHLAWCIDRHNGAIGYANLIEDIYTWNIGFAILFGMFLINALGLQILTSTRDLEAIARSIASILSLLCLFVMDCYVAQELMDHSINIGFYVYNNQWYRLSVEAQKLVQLMMMRCITPCRLTAGKMFVLSVNTCGLTLRTAASYFTILRSMHGL